MGSPKSGCSIYLFRNLGGTPGHVGNSRIVLSLFFVDVLAAFSFLRSYLYGKRVFSRVALLLLVSLLRPVSRGDLVRLAAAVYRGNTLSACCCLNHFLSWALS